MGRPTNIASAEADGGGRRCFFIFYGRQSRWINGRVMSGLARIGRHLVVRGGESAWCERADMAGGAGVDREGLGGSKHARVTGWHVEID